MPEERERSAKRPRTDIEDTSTSSDHSSSLEDLTHDAEFWLADGNIVLVAGGVGFKVYQGLLAEQSPIFSDVFSSATSDSSQLLESVPVVHLSDSPQDLRHLLRALLPNKQRYVYVTHQRRDLSLHQLSALVRLGHKYQIDDVQGQAVSALKTYLVSNFSSWLNRKAVFKVSDGCGIEMIHLARLLDMPTLLPVAFYNATLVRGDVVNGWSLEDGTRRYLEPDDLRRFIEGYATLRRKAEHMLARVFDTRPSEDCSGIDCDEALPKMYARDIKPLAKDHFPLKGWDSVNRCNKYSICGECVDMLKACYKTERATFWKELPALFDLTVEGWDGSASATQ